MRSNLSPSLRSRYDYYYSTLSPASSAANFYENQNLSLFGDPVPPATDFLETLDTHLYGSFRRSSFSDATVATVASPHHATVGHPTATSYNVLDEMAAGRAAVPFGRDYMRMRSTTTTASSSCESSAGAQRRRPSGMSQHSDRPMSTFGPVGDAHNYHHPSTKRTNSAYSQQTQSGSADSYRNHADIAPVPPKRIFSSEPSFYANQHHHQQHHYRSSHGSTPLITHLHASEPPPLLSTFAANNWAPQQLGGSDSATSKPTQSYPNHFHHQQQLDDWNNNGNRLPRPSLSRNVSEITHGGCDSSDSGVCGGGGGGGGDAMVAIIADTTASSSEERFSSSSPPTCSRKGSSSVDMQPYQVLPYDAKKADPNPSSSTVATNTSVSLSGAESGSDAGGAGCDGDSGIVGRSSKRDFSPTIFKETVTTGSYRINQPRQHKKASFAIINEYTGHSRAPSPTSGRTSPFRGKGFRPPISSRTSSRPISPAAATTTTVQHLTVEPISIEDLSRPGTVHFNTKTYTESSITTSTGDQTMESYEIQTDLKHKTLIQIPARAADHKPFEVLPDAVTRSKSSGPSPAPRRRFYNSTGDLSAPSKPPVNPRSYQKGLLRVVSSAQSSPSKIPRRKSITSSQDLMVPSAARRSSVSPNRRLSNVGASVKGPSSIIDLGIVAAGSTGVSRSNSRISKPTTLSPIIGTPNKDSEASGQEDNIATDSGDKTRSPITSPTRIPVRAGSTANLLSRRNSGAGALSKSNSRVNSTVNSRANSRSTSREPSPGAALKPGSISRSGSNSFSRAGSNRSSTKSTLQPKSTTKPAAGKPTASEKDQLRSSMRQNVNNRSSTGLKAATKKSTIALPKKESATATSTLRKTPTMSKREGSKVQRESSNLKRTPSNRDKPSLKREPTNLKRENSSLKKSTEAASTVRSSLKRQSSKIDQTAAQAKKGSDGKSTNKRLEKTDSFKKDKPKIPADSEDAPAAAAVAPVVPAEAARGDKLVAMTKSSVISMTTAAITAQPVQITTAVTNTTGATNGVGGQPHAPPAPEAVTAQPTATTAAATLENETAHMQSPAEILEKSQKTLECIQKTVTEATDEINRTIDENLTDLRSLENDLKGVAIEHAGPGVGKASGGPAPLQKNVSNRSLVSKKGSGSSLLGNGGTSEPEASVVDGGVVSSVVNSGKEASETLLKRDSRERLIAAPDATGTGAASSVDGTSRQTHGDEIVPQRTSPKGSGSETGDNDSQKSDATVERKAGGCCRCLQCCSPCFGFLCLPCTRLGRSACCQRCRRSRSPTPPDTVEHRSVSDTAPTKSSKTFCGCCRRSSSASSETEVTRSADAAAMAGTAKEPGKCGLCLSKFLCCRRTNKVEQTSASMASAADDASPARRKCCFCIPCGRKKQPENAAWQETRRESILSEPQKSGCCARLCNKLLCCRRKEPAESRRTSMNSKKQSIAPTLPPEDTRTKLDDSLVEHTSMMKAAIPVLPPCLAWFCLICNCFIPGLGTIFSGLFCLCIGVPRFSQHDGARARIGSFVINCIVGVSQMFTLLFCLVGWGWSIWWGTIMLRLARKRRKLKQAEIDAEMQQEETTTSSNRTAAPPIRPLNMHRNSDVGSVAGPPDDPAPAASTT